jgi:phosphate-selective porin OprO/OprP
VVHCRHLYSWTIRVLAGWLVTATASSWAQPPAPQPPTPTPVAALSREAQLEERLKRLESRYEEMERRHVEQYEALNRRYQSLIESRPGAASASNVPPSVPDTTAPSVSESGARPSRSIGPSDAAAAVTAPETGVAGSDETAPSLSESAARPSRRSAGGSELQSTLLPAKTFYDQKRYGFLFQLSDGEFELRLNSLLQVDARVFAQTNQNPVSDSIDIPRARLYFSGRVTKPIEYQVSIQRGENTLDLLNAYLNFHYDDRFQFRAGRFKPPFTFEWYKMTTWEFFTPERSPFALNFGPNRQVGFMGWGFLFKERLEYAVALTGGGRNSYLDYNYAKDVMALLDYKPFFDSGRPALKNLAIGGSVDAGRQNNPLVPAALRTTVNGSNVGVNAGTGDALIAPAFLAFNGNVRERGDRELWELHATYFYKSLSLLGVWDSGHNDFSLTTAGARPVHVPVSGYFFQAAYLLTGETRERASLIEPNRPFDLRAGKRGLGAFELQARYSNLALGRQVFTGGLADPNLWTDRVDLVDVGLNWYLNKFVKVYFDWEHAMYAQPVYYRPGPGLMSTSDLFWFRLMMYL